MRLAAKEIITKDNRITRAVDRVILALVVLVGFNLSGSLMELDGVAIYMWYFLMVTIGLAMVLLAAMDIYDFIDELTYDDTLELEDYEAEYEDEVLEDMGFYIIRDEDIA